MIRRAAFALTACFALRATACDRTSSAPVAGDAPPPSGAVEASAPTSAPSSASSVAPSAEREAVDPRLLRLEEALRGTFERYAPEAVVELKARTLVARTRTQVFMVHGAGMNGELSKHAIEELGPNHRGFLLEVTIAPGTHRGQGFGSPTVSGPYWQTFASVHPLAGREGYVSMSLKFGKGTDDELIKQLKAKVAAFASARAPSP